MRTDLQSDTFLSDIPHLNLGLHSNFVLLNFSLLESLLHPSQSTRILQYISLNVSSMFQKYLKD